MDYSTILEVDDLLEKVKGQSSDDAIRETVEKLLKNIIISANLHVEKVYDKVLFNEKNSPIQKRIITACLLRLLYHKEDIIWEDMNLRVKTFELFDDQLKGEYQLLKIKPNDKNHIKLSKLKDLELNLYNEFDYICNMLVSIHDLNEFRTHFIRGIKHKIYNIFIDCFISKSLINIQRLNSLFTDVVRYEQGSLSEKIVLYPLVEQNLSSFIDEAKSNASTITCKCIVDPLTKLYNIVKKDFDSNDVIKNSFLFIESPEIKYQLHLIGKVIDLKFRVRNDGPGMAFNTQIEVVDIEKNLNIKECIYNIGDMEPKYSQLIIFQATVKEASVKDISIMLECKWESYDKVSHSKLEILELEPQRHNFDWDVLRHQQPYSLEEVDTEEELIGRNEVVSNLYSKLIASKIESSIIYGQKRVGKTSIAKIIINKIKKIDYYIPIFIRIGYLDKTTATSFVKGLGEQIYYELSRMDKFKNIVKPVFESALAPLINYFKDINYCFPEYRFLIILDEFDEIPIEFYHHTNIQDTFFHNIRSLSSEGYIGFVLVGAENMQIIKQTTDRLNKFYSVRVDYFHKSSQWKDFQDLIRQPVIEKIEFSDNAISKIYNMTEGNPFFTKFICKVVYEKACSKRNAYITEDEIDEAIDDSIYTMDTNNIDHFWIDGIVEDESAEKDLIETQRRKFLTGFAEIRKLKGSEKITKTDITTFDMLAKEVAVNEMISSFINREILYEEQGYYRIKPRFIEKWLVERGIKIISNSVIDKKAIDVLRKREEEDYVTDRELINLTKKWGLFRGQQITTPDVRCWLDQFKNNYEKRIVLSAKLICSELDKIICRKKSCHNCLAIKLQV